MKSKIIDFSNLKGDFIGGLVAGVVAYHSPLHWCAIRNGATAGLYGAIMVGIFAAIFGGTPTQASGPTGPMTVVSAALVAASIQLTGSLETALGIILLTSSRWSLQIIFGLINIAGYVKYFPYPVVSGFMSGVGLIIILLQLFPLWDSIRQNQPSQY
jgi:SulP family sulfate permease